MEKYEEVIITDTTADVATDNYEEFDQEIIPEKLGDKLIQSNSLKGTSRELQFYAENNLLLNSIEKKGAPNRIYRINLSWLTADPTHNKVIIWKWLYGALACTTVTGAFIYMATAQIIRPDYCYIIATITFSLALILTLIFIYCMRDEFIFKSCFGNAEIFTLENKKPDLKKFDNFYLTIQQVIDQSQKRQSVADRLVGELKMCRRLRDEGILDDETYTYARTVIFKHKEYKT